MAARASTMLAIRPPSGTPTGGIPATGGIMSSSGESRGGAASRGVVELTDSRSATWTTGDRLGYLRAPREVEEVPMEKKQKKKRKRRRGSRGSSGSPVLSPCPSRYARRSPVEERGKMLRSVSRLMRRQRFVVPPGRRDDLIDQPRRRAICQDMVACLTLHRQAQFPK